RTRELAIRDLQAVLRLHRVEEDFWVVRRHLVAEAAAPAVEHDDHLIRPRDPEPGREVGIGDTLGTRHLDLQIVVARAERAELISAALERARAHPRDVGTGEAAALLRPVEVLLGGEAAAATPARALLEHVGELRLAELHEPLGPDAGRPAREQRVDELADTLADLLFGEVGERETHPAVDVEADAARRDDPALRVHRR